MDDQTPDATPTTETMIPLSAVAPLFAALEEAVVRNLLLPPSLTLVGRDLLDRAKELGWMTPRTLPPEVSDAFRAKWMERMASR